jgi:hypothetical protein
LTFFAEILFDRSLLQGCYIPPEKKVEKQFDYPLTDNGVRPGPGIFGTSRHLNYAGIDISRNNIKNRFYRYKKV